MFAKRALLAILVAVVSTPALAQEKMTGSFRMSHTTAEVFDPATAEALSTAIAQDEEVQWQVFVPETYSADRPPGVFVFIDPDGWGGMPDQYRQLFTNRNMIWIGAKSNERNPEASKKMVQVMMAERVIDQNYSVNLNRLYLGSAGDDSYVALNVMLRLNEFNGALYINGSSYWHGGRPETLDYLMRKPHVFVIGTGDKLWNTVRKDYENYKKDGIEKVKLLYRKGTIRKWPEVEQMDEALAFLDAR